MTVAAVACPACGFDTFKRDANIRGVPYLQCGACDTVRSAGPLGSAVHTHNDQPEVRNRRSTNLQRIARAEDALGRPIEWAVDLGCGQGELIALLQQLDVVGYGVDRDTSLQMKDIDSASIDVVFMVESIEHLQDPARYLREVARVLKDEGVLYVETSFVDGMDDWTESAYVDPRIGHCTVLSKKGLSVLCDRAGLRVETYVNDNAVIIRRS